MIDEAAVKQTATQYFSRHGALLSDLLRSMLAVIKRTAVLIKGDGCVLMMRVAHEYETHAR